MPRTYIREECCFFGISLSIHPWPRAITYNIHPSSRGLSATFFYNAVISCSLKASKLARSLARSLAQHRRLLPNMPQFRTREHFTEQGLLIRTKYSSIALSVFPDACPHAITGNRLFPSATLRTWKKIFFQKFKKLTKSPH